MLTKKKASNAKEWVRLTADTDSLQSASHRADTCLACAASWRQRSGTWTHATQHNMPQRSTTRRPQRVIHRPTTERTAAGHCTALRERCADTRYSQYSQCRRCQRPRWAGRQALRKHTLIGPRRRAALAAAYYDELKSELALENTQDDPGAEQEGRPLKPLSRRPTLARQGTASSLPNPKANGRLPPRTPRAPRTGRQRSNPSFAAQSARAPIASAGSSPASSRSALAPSPTTPYLAEEPAGELDSVEPEAERASEVALQAEGDGPSASSYHDEQAIMLRRAKRERRDTARDFDGMQGIA
jgi:hypothetical protein